MSRDARPSNPTSPAPDSAKLACCSPPASGLKARERGPRTGEDWSWAEANPKAALPLIRLARGCCDRPPLLRDKTRAAWDNGVPRTAWAASPAASRAVTPRPAVSEEPRRSARLAAMPRPFCKRLSPAARSPSGTGSPAGCRSLSRSRPLRAGRLLRCSSGPPLRPPRARARRRPSARSPNDNGAPLGSENGAAAPTDSGV